MLRSRALLAIGACLLSACLATPDRSEDSGSRDAAVDAGTPDAGSAAEVLGARCSAASPCAASLTCLDESVPDRNGGSVAGGMCTLECTSDPGVCERTAPGSSCLRWGDSTSYCFPGCTWGPSYQTTLSPAKCHARPELACGWAMVPTGVACPAGSCADDGTCWQGNCYVYPPTCLPSCNSDADCSGGRFCDPRNGRCTVSAPPSDLDPVGAACSSSGPNTCAGYCLTMGSHQVCTRACTWDVDETCGWSGSGEVYSACTGSFSSIIRAGGPGAGDYAYCLQLCDCPSDCATPGMKCERLHASTAAQLGKAGVCIDYNDNLHDFISCGSDAGGVDAQPADGGSREDASGGTQ